MNIRTLLLIYFAAFAAGAVYKYVLYLFQPDTFTHINSAVLELSIVSALVTAGMAILYILKKKKAMQEDGRND